MRLVKEVKAQARHPIQICVLVWWIVAAVSGLILGPSPNSHLSETTSTLLGSVLLVSATVCLVGSLIRDIVGLALEMWGWAGNCLLFIVYGWVVIAYTPEWKEQLGTAVFFVPFIIGGGWRVAQIGRAQKRLRRINDNEIDPVL